MAARIDDLGLRPSRGVPGPEPVIAFVRRNRIRYPTVIFSANISPERSSSAPCMASCLV
jgi:hypothetical protein